MMITLAFPLLFLLLISCSNGTSIDPDIDPDPDPVPPEPVLYYSYTVTEALPNPSFNRPRGLTLSGDQSGRLLLPEPHMVSFGREKDSTVSQKNLFLDISSLVEREGNEQGLLGLAFHPDYSSNGHFFVNYTEVGTGTTVISRFTVSGDPGQADSGSEVRLMEIEQPLENHNGGDMAFGPDGYLYIALGDGGGAGDPEANGQDRTTLLGAILRIDPDQADGDRLYSIPSDNPFVGNSEGFREEIYAYGLRNPWRFSFDAESGELWVADVGQEKWEEINIVEKVGND